MASRKIVCACDVCALPYSDITSNQFKLIPLHPRALPQISLSTLIREELGRHGGVTFLVWDSYESRSCLLQPDSGGFKLVFPGAELAAHLGELLASHALEPDVEVLLFEHTGKAAECYVVPLDYCYELAGLTPCRQNPASEVAGALKRFLHSTGTTNFLTGNRQVGRCGCSSGGRTSLNSQIRQGQQ